MPRGGSHHAASVSHRPWRNTSDPVGGLRARAGEPGRGRRAPRRRGGGAPSVSAASLPESADGSRTTPLSAPSTSEATGRADERRAVGSARSPPPAGSPPRASDRSPPRTRGIDRPAGPVVDQPGPVPRPLRERANGPARDPGVHVLDQRARRGQGLAREVATAGQSALRIDAPLQHLWTLLRSLYRSRRMSQPGTHL